MYRAYLVDTQSLTPAERKETLVLLATPCCEMPPSVIGSSPFVFMALTKWSADDFKALPFPTGCTITDVTGQNLLKYR